LRYERSEQSLSTLRTSLMQLIGALDSRSLRSSAAAQKQALLALADVGELMVPEFPYNVPSQGREYETLPRLLGRAKVTFTVRRPSPASGRRNPALDRFVEQAFPELTELVSTFSIGRELDRYELVGNVSIVADGFTAPITAGNFVDLAQRGFYNNLPIKTRAVESTSLPILGSFNDGFVVRSTQTLSPSHVKLDH
jgi:peptidylprolyl isomerase